MMSALQFYQTKAEPDAVNNLKIPRKEMMKVCGPTFGILMTAFMKQAVEPDIPNCPTCNCPQPIPGRRQIEESNDE